MKSSNQTQEFPLGLGRKFGRVADARTHVFEGGRSANRSGKLAKENVRKLVEPVCVVIGLYGLFSGSLLAYADTCPACAADHDIMLPSS